MEPIEVSKECYEAVDEYLESVYHEYPFERIIKGGKRLGYEGFMENFDLHIEDEGAKINVSLVTKSGGEVKHSQRFEK